MKNSLLGIFIMMSAQSYAATAVKCDQRGQEVKVEIKKDSAGTEEYVLTYPYYKGDITLSKPKKVSDGHFIFNGVAKAKRHGDSDTDIQLEVNGGDYLSVSLIRDGADEIPYFKCEADLLRLEEVSIKTAANEASLPAAKPAKQEAPSAAR